MGRSRWPRMAHKTRPFTRKQRNRMLVKQRMAERQELREVKQEAKDYGQTLDIFKRCDPERTERLADG